MEQCERLREVFRLGDSMTLPVIPAQLAQYLSEMAEVLL